MIPVADMCSGSGGLSTATQGALLAPTGRTPPPHRDDQGRLNARFAEWMMGLPAAGNPSRRARIRLAGNAAVGRQAALMLARALARLNSTV